MILNEAAFREKNGLYHLLEALHYSSERYGAVITVPSGFISDLASVPDIIPPFLVNDSGKITYAAIVHDYLYATKGGKLDFTKGESDLMFRDIMIERGMPRWRAYLAWLGVTLNVKALWEWDK